LDQRLPEFRPPLILHVPQLEAAIAPVSKFASGRLSMGTAFDHRRSAEECVAMARLADDNGDKALWLALAHSWVMLAEHVSRIETDDDELPEDASEVETMGASVGQPS
jgi:hypothetical protein